MKAIKKIIKALKEYDNFLITSHINSEGDSIGSQLAMAYLLKRLKKKYIIVDNDPIPKLLTFLLDGEKIKTHLTERDRFDAIITVDCPSIGRTGRVAQYFKDAKIVINIDHHVSNANFGDVIWVEPDMSSCGEMLYCLYRRFGVKIGQREALPMYVAIVTDTGCFSYENTTSQTHAVVSDLLKSGIKPLLVGRQLNEQKTLNDLRLLSETLETLEVYRDGQVAVLYTSKEMLNRLNLRPESAEGFVNYARSINTVKIAVFLLERPDKPGEVHVSFRSKGDVDVNKVARIFNGGGHPNASGCMFNGSIAQAKKIVLAKIKPFLSTLNSKP